MSGAWKATVDLKLGLFRPDPPIVSPLAAHEGVTLAPQPPFLQPHRACIRVTYHTSLQTNIRKEDICGSVCRDGTQETPAALQPAES